MTSNNSCSKSCDFSDRQSQILESLPDLRITITIQALYWGVHCTDWHFISLNSIGSAYPSHYGHFDREIALTGSSTMRSYYLTDNVIEIPRHRSRGDLSSYAFCYIPQQQMDTTTVNHGFTTNICKDIRKWYGPVIVFATDPKNHVRRMQPEDTTTATETINKHIHTRSLPFRIPYSPPVPSTKAENHNLIPPPPAFSNTLSNMPLSLLFDVAGFNAYMAQAVRTELRGRVRAVIAFYIKHDVEDFIRLVERLHGVYVGFAVLDFVNGFPLPEDADKNPLEIIMDNGAVDELITFFTDKDNPDLVVTFENENPTVWETEDFCRRVVKLQTNNNPNRHLTVYATTHSSIYPLLLSKNLTTFASGFTQTAFFSFYPTHLLQQKQCIAGPNFKGTHSDEQRTYYEHMLRQRGHTLRYSHIGTNADPSAGCTKFRRRVDDLTGTTVFVWGIENDDEQDRIEKSMLEAQYTWVNGADCNAPCCVTI